MSARVERDDTKRRDAGHGARLLAGWHKLSPLPGGKWLFSRIVGRSAPYTGTLRALVTSLEPGRAEVRLRDRRGVRNHLRSVHAIALANLGELASGLAATTALPPDVRGIPNRITVDYLRKARGTLTAVGTAHIGSIDGPTDTEVEATITNAGGETVATVRVRWRLERV